MIEFFLPVDKESGKYIGTGIYMQLEYLFVTTTYLNYFIFTGVIDVSGREVRIKIQKKEKDWWPRLLYETKEIKTENY